MPNLYNTEEVWRHVKGYEGLYKVSNLGRVRSVVRVVHFKDGRIRRYAAVILRPGDTISSSGGIYKTVSLWKGNRGKSFLVHRLVAEAFIPNLDDLPEVNHKDTDPSNNKLTNLEWVSHGRNMRHAKENGLMRHLNRDHASGSRNGNSKLTEADVKAIRARLEQGETQAAVASDYGVSQVSVSNIQSRRTWNSI